MPLGQQTTAGVDRDTSPDRCGALVDQPAALPLSAQAEFLVDDELGRGRCVVHLGDVQILRTDAGHFVRLARHPLGHAGLAGFVIPARAEDRGFDVHRLGGELLGFGGAGQHDGRGAVADRRTHHARQRIGDHGRCQHVLHAAWGLELGVRVEAAVGVVFGRHRGVVLFGGAVFAHVAARELGIEVHEHAARLACPFARLLGRLLHVGQRLLHQLDVDGAADRGERLLLVFVGELFHAERQHHVVHARRHVQPGQMKRGGRAGAGVLGIDDRNAADAHLAQHDLPPDALLPGNQAGHRIADRHGLERVRLDPRGLQRRFHGFARQVFHALVHVFGEPGHARADDGNFSHGVLPFRRSFMMPLFAGPSGIPAGGEYDRSRMDRG